MSTHATQRPLRKLERGGTEHRVDLRMSLILFGLILVLVGCIAGYEIANHHAGSSPVTTESRSVQASSARSVQARLIMQPGNLHIQGSASHLLDARFRYQPAAWRPEVSYRVSGSQGDLAVRQPHLQSVTISQNTWNVRLSDRMPMDLNVTSGPGNATLGLRTLALRTLAMTAGPGNVTIDAGSPSLQTLTITAGPGNLTMNLNTPWKHNVSASIDGGIGNTTLRLPATIGVQVTVHGMAQVIAADFAKQGDRYVNAAFANSKPAIRVSLTAGMGNVVLTTGT